MTKILLMRHGHVEGIDPPRFRGRLELDLTALGQAQARLTGVRIAAEWSPSAVYSSPMQRCLDTAMVIATASGDGQVMPLEGLQDIDYGDWQGHLHSEIATQDPQTYAVWEHAPHLVRLPGGESLQDVVARTADGLRTVLSAHPHGVVVMVGHDSVNRLLLLQCLDQPLSAYRRLELSPCGLTEVDIDGADIRVMRINETGHLRGPTP